MTSPLGFLHGGIDMVAIPGPTILPEPVREALSRSMPNIYAGALIDLSERVLERLPGVVRTSGRGLIAIGNGHTGWQMAISNTTVPGDTVIALESGRFARVWGEYATAAGVDVESIQTGFRDPVNLDALAARLEADKDGSVVAIMVAHTDTASSVRNDIQAIRSTIDAAGHDALLMVDGIAAIGADRFEMDAWGVDVTVGASQKGLMCPPGMAFVWVGDRAIERFRSLPSDRPVVASLDWAPRLEPTAFYETYAGTPPVPMLRAFDVALDLIDESGGLDVVWHRHEVLASSVRAAVDAWSVPGGLEHNIAQPEFRSNAVTTVLTGDVDAIELRRVCEAEFGLVLGLGIGEDRAHSFRIGHMGHLNPPMILGTLGTIEAGLERIGAPLGASGVAAAAKVIGGATSADY